MFKNVIHNSTEHKCGLKFENFMYPAMFQQRGVDENVCIMSSYEEQKRR